jgi:hypothetical protein
MNSFIHFPASYTFIPTPDPETEATAARVEQTKATVTKPQPQDAPINLDTALNRLDVELAKLDDLAAKEREFPKTIAGIESKLTELEAQDLDTLPALEARSAQAGKLANMKQLAASQAHKTRAKVAQQQKAVIEIGTRITDLLDAKWWQAYTKRADEIEREFSRLFYRSALDQTLQTSYKPITLLQRLRAPNLRVSRFSPPDVLIAKCRQLLGTANKLVEFEKLSFAEIAARVEK